MVVFQHFNTNAGVGTMREDRALPAFSAMSQEHSLRLCDCW
jgi:hypothetical protein